MQFGTSNKCRKKNLRQNLSQPTNESTKGKKKNSVYTIPTFQRQTDVEKREKTWPNPFSAPPRRKKKLTHKTMEIPIGL